MRSQKWLRLLGVAIGLWLTIVLARPTAADTSCNPLGDPAALSQIASLEQSNPSLHAAEESTQSQCAGNGTLDTEGCKQQEIQDVVDQGYTWNCGSETWVSGSAVPSPSVAQTVPPTAAPPTTVPQSLPLTVTPPATRTLPAPSTEVTRSPSSSTTTTPSTAAPGANPTTALGSAAAVQALSADSGKSGISWLWFFIPVGVLVAITVWALFRVRRQARSHAHMGVRRR